MTVKEMRKLINNLPDDAEIEVNSIYENEELESSSICEAHYCKNNNKVYITPTVVSI